MVDFLTKTIAWLKNRDNVTFAIAVAAFVMSVYNFTVERLHNSKHLDIEISGVFRPQNEPSPDVVNLKIYNRSYRPVVLSRVTISSNQGARRYGGYRREILRIDQNENGKSVAHEQWFSDRLPVKIDGESFADLLIVPDDGTGRFPIGEKLTVTLHTSTVPVKKCITTASNRLLPYKLLSQCRGSES